MTFRSTLLFLVALTAVVSQDARAQNAIPTGGKLPTRWDTLVSATSPLPEYPRPQMVRRDWMSLNGQWDYSLTNSDVTQPPATYTGKILVPYPYESSLSGIAGGSIPHSRLWYHRSFLLPNSWNGKTVLLHFGAVNYDSTVSVNGGPPCEHLGGYTAFTINITPYLKHGLNDIVVSASNPLRVDTDDAQVVGKQREHSSGIWYTSVTGIWQTVWLEPVGKEFISQLHLVPDIDSSTLTITCTQNASPGAQIKAVVKTEHGSVTSIGDASMSLAVPISQEHLWSPMDPHLYDLQVSLIDGGSTVDSVRSYFAMRKVSVGPDDNGVLRILLNNKFVPEIGLLDQGYWPDGVYTAPTDDALSYDILQAKALGFNLLRKHAKVEPDRWYYHADQVGMLVWQDMPQMFGGQDGHLTDTAKSQFHDELFAEINELWNHPSIIVWTTFNEGWGQHDTQQIASQVKILDPSRLVNSASGWVDMKVGDISDTHAYPRPWSAKASDMAPRAVVNGEFGGVPERIPGHMWTDDLFGYGSTLSGSWLLTRSYQDLLKTAYGLIQTQGTSAFVYTQITDVEQESNGLITFDRAVLKPIASIIVAANAGIFPDLPPDPNSSLPTVAAPIKAR